MVRPRSSAGFTVLELLVSMGILGIMLSMGFANVAEMKSQMDTSSEIRRLALTLNSLRNEAIRLRANVSVTFTSSGYSWDIYDDGSAEGSHSLGSHCNWNGSTPDTFTFNGLGLARGIGATRTLTIANGGIRSSLTINTNGFVSM